jgi:aspartate kinase
MLKLHKTDSNYRDATVDWDLTHKNISKMKKHWTLPKDSCSDENNFTTLGREGSDYTAAILPIECWQRHHLERCSWVNESTLFWMPVYWIRSLIVRLLNAFYGNGHPPKTLQPLQERKFLYIKSFINPGTSVSRGVNLEPYLPCFIVKRNQLLISLVYWLFLYYGRKHQWNIFFIPWV